MHYVLIRSIWISWNSVEWKIIYVGSFPEIVDFLKAQDFIDEVEHIHYSPKEDGYWLFFFHLSIRKDPDKVLEDFVKSRNLGDHRKYVNLQLNFGGGDELELFEDYLSKNSKAKILSEIEKVGNDLKAARKKNSK